VGTGGNDHARISETQCHRGHGVSRNGEKKAKGGGMTKTIVFKKCSICKEVLGIEEFHRAGRDSWCRMCAAEKARQYRKTTQYREASAAYRSRPEVKEARRNSERLRKRVRSEWKTPRGKLLCLRNLARYRARRYEIEGNDTAAKHQRNRVEILTREIKRMDRDSKRDKVDVLNLARAKRKQGAGV
jgi:hypothetical protein